MNSFISHQVFAFALNSPVLLPGCPLAKLNLKFRYKTTFVDMNTIFIIGPTKLHLFSLSWCTFVFSSNISVLITWSDAEFLWNARISHQLRSTIYLFCKPPEVAFYGLFCNLRATEPRNMQTGSSPNPKNQNT